MKYTTILKYQKMSEDLNITEEEAKEVFQSLMDKGVLNEDGEPTDKGKSVIRLSKIEDKFSHIENDFIRETLIYLTYCKDEIISLILCLLTFISLIVFLIQTVVFNL